MLGHPLHPVTVHLPIGLLLAASLLDALVALGIRPQWADFAQGALIGGLLAAGLAVCAGFVDFLSIPPGAKMERTATLHIAFILAALTLYGGALAWRMIGPADAGIAAILSVAGGFVLMVAGWFGGQLVYHFGQGVRTKEKTS